MAVVAWRVSTTNTSNTSSYASSSFTPSDGDLLVVFVVASATVAAGDVNGSTGLTFTKITSATKNSSADTIYMFVADALATNTSQTVTFTCTGDAATGAIVTVFSVTGVSKTGSAAVRQSAVQNNQAAGGTPAPAFDVSALLENPTLGVVGNATNPAGLTPPTGWDESAGADTGYNNPATGSEAVFKNAVFTGTTITWGSTSATAFGSIIAELDTSVNINVSDTVTASESSRVQIPNRSTVIGAYGFETGAIATDEALAGNSSIVSSPVFSGSYAGRINCTTTGIGSFPMFGLGADGVNNPTGGFGQHTLYMEFRFRYATKSTAATGEEFAKFRRADTANKASLRLNNDGTIGIYDSNTTLVATSSTTLDADTWYLIGFMTGTGTSAPYELRINNVTELSGYLNASTTTHNGARLGKTADRNSTSVDYYYDDVIFDGTQFNGGTVKVKVAMPTANSSPMQWTAGTGGSDYTQVNEIPFASTSYVQSTAANDVAMFTPQTLAQMDISGAQIKGVKLLTNVREDVSGTSGVKARLVSGATTVDTSTLDPTTTNTVQAKFFSADPNAPTANWTETNFNSLTIGSVETTSTAQRLNWVGLMVAYELTTLSVSDTVTTAESVNLFIPQYNIAVSDSATVSESVSVSFGAQPDATVSVSDSSSVSEALALEITTSVNTSDSTSVADTLSSPEVITNISTSDSVSAAESVSVSIGGLPDTSLNVSDSTALSETLTIEVTTSISNSDAINVTDAPTTPQVITNISTSDSVSAAESVSVSIGTLADINMSVSESASLSESLASDVTTSINKTESISVIDTPSTPGVTTNISAADTVNTTESVSTLSSLLISVSDSATAAEQVVLNMPMQIAESDSIGVSESIGLVIPEYNLQVADSVSVTESTSVSIGVLSDLFINVSDNSSLSESRTLLITSFISASDSVTTSEQGMVNILTSINTSDSVSVNETRVISSALAIAASENINIAETLTFASALAIAASEAIAVSESGQVSFLMQIAVSNLVTVAESTAVAIALGSAALTGFFEFFE